MINNIKEVFHEKDEILENVTLLAHCVEVVNLDNGQGDPLKFIAPFKTIKLKYFYVQFD